MTNVPDELQRYIEEQHRAEAEYAQSNHAAVSDAKLERITQTCTEQYRLGRCIHDAIPIEDRERCKRLHVERGGNQYDAVALMWMCFRNQEIVAPAFVRLLDDVRRLQKVLS